MHALLVVRFREQHVCTSELPVRNVPYIAQQLAFISHPYLTDIHLP